MIQAELNLTLSLIFRQEKPSSKKPSRFLRRDDWSAPTSSSTDRGSTPSGGYNVYDLADDVLGENIRPSREPAYSSRRLTHPRPGIGLFINYVTLFFSFSDRLSLIPLEDFSGGLIYATIWDWNTRGLMIQQRIPIMLHFTKRVALNQSRCRMRQWIRMEKWIQNHQLRVTIRGIFFLLVL